MFMVMVKMKFGIDDAFDCEYTGIEHDTKEAAEIELKEAENKLKDDNKFIYAYIHTED